MVSVALIIVIKVRLPQSMFSKYWSVRLEPDKMISLPINKSNDGRWSRSTVNGRLRPGHLIELE